MGIRILFHLLSMTQRRRMKAASSSCWMAADVFVIQSDLDKLKQCTGRFLMEFMKNNCKVLYPACNCNLSHIIVMPQD